MPSVGQIDNGAQEIANVLAEWQDAFGPRKNVEVLERVHHPEFVWTGADGSRMNRTEHIAAELQSDITNEIVELRTVARSGSAVSVGRIRLGGVFRSDTADRSTLDQINDATAQAGLIEIAFTMTWIREDIGWQVIAVHFSIVEQRE